MRMSDAVVREPARETPVVGEFDVVVVGGGPAGLMAAAAAARNGASVALLEKNGYLGGAGTAGGLSTFCGLHAYVEDHHVQAVRGLAQELVDRIDQLDGLRAPHYSLRGMVLAQAYDIPAYRRAADELLLGAGVHLVFHARVSAAHLLDGSVDAVMLETKEGRLAVRGRVFVDASGDGDLMYWAGVRHEHPGTTGMLFPSMMFRINGVDVEEAGEAWRTLPALMKEEAARGRRFPRLGAIIRPQRHPMEWRANTTQLRRPDGSALDGTRVADLTAGEIDGRAQTFEVFSFIKESHPGFQDSYVVDIGPEVGIRETRRMIGRYVLTEEDILGRATFPDAVGVNGWPVEEHVEGNVAIRFPDHPSTRANELPARMLVQDQVPNLLVAGRCASMSHGGQSAARVSGPAFAMGQAAGTIAALAVHQQVACADVDAADVQTRLRDDGALLTLEDVARSEAVTHVLDG
ncbi:FAD-dependent oxidoreductase [Georgenia alba]|uniref:FAD-dependent oxidoreductase n=1 Tax=Georgenia alba TaxID=2233858 RepID=A0ABW2QC69_9MICO